MAPDDDSVGVMERVVAESQIRELATDYARGADHHDGALVASLFLEGGVLEVVHVNSPPRRIQGREAIATGIATLEKWEATTHFLGQHVVQLHQDRATGEVHCQAHHVHVTETGRMVRSLWIRYKDDYAKRDGRWFFATRRVLVDWSEERPAPPETPAVLS